MNQDLRLQKSASTTPVLWWKGAVIYQIYPRSFADSNGDGVGDLPGIVEKLDYVASLGVDGIWLSPFFTSPMADFGYDISDYRDVDPIFGRLADFDRLIEKAHRLGLKVIIDQVYSHTSDHHAWFQESRQDRTNPKADWYIWGDAKPEGSPPSNWQSVFGGPAWTWDARRGQYYMHNFLAAQPDLNVHNPKVQEALLATGKFWLDRGVDGFRLDAINFSMHDPSLADNPPATDDGRRTRPFDFQQHLHNQSHADIPKFLHRIRDLLDSYGAGRFTVAEVGGEQADVEMKLFTQGEDRLNSAYGFTFLYAEALTAAITAKTFADWSGKPGEGWPSWAFSNHDAPRAVSRWTTPVMVWTTSLTLSRCWRFSVVMTLIPASRSSSTSCQRFSCSTPGAFVCANSSTRTISGRRSKIAGRSISSKCWPRYSIWRRAMISSSPICSAVWRRPWVST